MHGDAHRGNLIRTLDRLLLCDWDSASAGPREIDLVPTLQGARFGLSDGQRAGHEELRHRLRSLRAGEDTIWHPF